MTFRLLFHRQYFRFSTAPPSAKQLTIYGESAPISSSNGVTNNYQDDALSSYQLLMHKYSIDVDYSRFKTRVDGAVVSNWEQSYTTYAMAAKIQIQNVSAINNSSWK